MRSSARATFRLPVPTGSLEGCRYRWAPSMKIAAQRTRMARTTPADQRSSRHPGGQRRIEGLLDTVALLKRLITSWLRAGAGTA